MTGYRVLVAYATDGGGTARIAQAIGEELMRAGVDVDVCSVALARRLDRYDGVLVGSPHRQGSWHPDARGFLKRHRRTLASRPVWLFHIGSLYADGSSKLPMDVMREARRIGAVGVLNLIAPGAQTAAGDATIVDGITNIDAIRPLASLVIDTLDGRRAV